MTENLVSSLSKRVPTTPDLISVMDVISLLPSGIHYNVIPYSIYIHSAVPLYITHLVITQIWIEQGHVVASKKVSPGNFTQRILNECSCFIEFIK